MNIMVIGSIGGLDERALTDDLRQSLVSDAMLGIVNALVDAGIEVDGNPNLTVQVALGEPMTPDAMAERLIAEQQQEDEK